MLTQVVGDRIGQPLAGTRPNSERVGDGVRDEIGGGDRREIHEEHTVGERVGVVTSDRDRKTRLAAAAGTRECDEPRPVDPRRHLALLVFPTDEARRAARKPVPGDGGGQCREVVGEHGVGQLEQALGSTQIAQPMLSEVAQADGRRQGISNESTRCLGDEHLATPRHAARPGGAVHGRSVVVAVAEFGFARVHDGAHRQCQ